MKISPIRLGVTLGIIWGGSILILAFVTNRQYGSLLFNIISDVYIGCSKKNVITKFICGGLAFIDAFIGGVLIAVLYNYLPIN
jgi:hypothetical protein